MIASDLHPDCEAGDGPNVETRIGELQPRRERRRAAMDRVEAIGFHIIGETRRAADAADEHGVFGRRADFGHGALHRLQNRIVAAAGAPAYFLIGFPILARRGAGDGGHLVHQRAPSIAASISAMVKGWPDTLFTGFASTRYWSRSTVLSWPVFISGTITLS